MNGCQVTLTIYFGDDPWGEAGRGPDEVLSVCNVVDSKTLGNRRRWRYTVRSFGERMRAAVVKTDTWMNAYARQP